MSRGLRDGAAVAAVVVDRVSVAYRGMPDVVVDVSLAVGRGRWSGIIGRNGAGKSSLLKAMAGLVEHRGSIRFEPSGVAADLGHRRGRSRWRPPARTVAFVAQQPVLPAGMTVAEYVLLGRTAHLRWLAMEGRRDRRIVDHVLARLSMTDFADRPVTELSGGEVQRAALARALAQEAAVLLLDEPTSALDIGHRIGVMELIDELRRERDLTVVTAMHDLGTAGRFADELVLLHRGEVVASGPPAAVLTESILSRYYETPVQVLTDDDGDAVIVPLRRRHPDPGA